MDSLSLRNIRVKTYIGVPEEERTHPQEIFVSIEFLHPTIDVARTDDPSRGIDYEAAVRTIERLAAIERKTIERFAEDVATAMLVEWKPASGVRVTVEKHPKLPLATASITITRP